MSVSLGARKIGETSGSTRLDELYLAGLLHDIGKVVYPMFAKESFDACLEDDSEDPGLAKESRMFGMDHAELGTHLAEAWNFPPVIYHVIRYHHAPANAPEPSRDVVNAVGLADRSPRLTAWVIGKIPSSRAVSGS
jgi:putative nucleotidyltransferase with HDIG domain